MEKKIFKLLLIGFGSVGTTLAEILSDPSSFARFSSFHTSGNAGQFSVVGIVTRTKGVLINQNGIDLCRAVRDVRKTGKFSLDNPDLQPDCPDAVSVSACIDYDVLVELSTLSIRERGEPASSHVRAALSAGRHVVSANKGPLAFCYRELTALAKAQKAQFLFESCVMDGAPVFNLAKHCLRACRIIAVSGVLNSTTNFVLQQLEEGRTQDEAIEVAQQRGFAEADPSLDIDGWDAAAKISVLANVLLGADISPTDVEVAGIRGATVQLAQDALARGKRLKLICRATTLPMSDPVGPGEGKATRVRACVGLEEVDAKHPFGQVNDSGSVVRIETDFMGPLLVWIVIRVVVVVAFVVATIL
jgi:homoserine dehydrogenase